MPHHVCSPGIHLDMWDVMSYVVKYVHVNMYNIALHVGWIVVVAEGGLVNK